MNGRNWYRNNAWVLLSLICLVTSGLLFFRLSDSPFGTAFWGSLYAGLLGLFALLLITILRLLTSPKMWNKLFGYVFTVASSILFITLVTVSIDYRLIFFREIPSKLSVMQWHQDLDFLAETLVEQHQDLFAGISSESFYGAIEALEEELTTLSDQQIASEFMKIVALPNDGHSNIIPFQPAFNPRVYPLVIYPFSDGFYVTDASREYRHIIGSRLVQIGDAKIEKVYNAIKPIISAENDFQKRWRFIFYGLIAELLQTEGLIKEAENQEFVFEDENGSQYKAELSPEPFYAYMYWFRIRPGENEVSAAIPHRRKNNYWFEYLDNSRTIYFQFNEVQNQSSGESIEAFVHRLEQFIDNHAVERLVIDIRNNLGGNGTLGVPIVDMLSSNKRINQRGKLFTIIGRKTYSAALHFASMLENRTKTLFVGEATGEGPNHFGDNETFVLPHSKINVVISAMRWEGSIAEDERQWIDPDISVEYSHQDYLMKRDPAMLAILEYQNQAIDTVSVPVEQLEKFVGRYLFSPYQIVEIQRVDEHLRFNITDFIGNSLSEVDSDLYPISESRFLTDIRNVYLDVILDPQSNSQKLIFSWDGTQKKLQRLGDDFLLPLQLLDRGKIDEGLDGLFINGTDRFTMNNQLEIKIDQLGWANLDKKQYRPAIKLFEANVRLYPDSANSNYSMAEAYLQNGQKMQALNYYMRTFEILPNDQVVLDKIEELEMELN